MAQTAQLLGICNSLLAVGLAMIFGLGALSPHTRCKFLVRCGLLVMAIGYGVTAWMLHGDPLYTEREWIFGAQLVANSGLTLVVIGWMIRTRAGMHHMRRRSDWLEVERSTNSGKWGEL